MAEDVITVCINGPKKIRQAVVDAVYLAVMDEDLLDEFDKPKAELSFSSTLDPSDEVAA